MVSFPRFGHLSCYCIRRTSAFMRLVTLRWTSLASAPSVSGPRHALKRANLRHATASSRGYIESFPSLGPKERLTRFAFCKAAPRQIHSLVNHGRVGFGALTVTGRDTWRHGCDLHC